MKVKAKKLVRILVCDMMKRQKVLVTRDVTLGSVLSGHIDTEKGLLRNVFENSSVPKEDLNKTLRELGINRMNDRAYDAGFISIVVCPNIGPC